MPDHSHSNKIRKRVCTACDRCRLKKSKCDGGSPCLRCRADNTICVFGERKKAHNRVYPKGYVEMLERQQSWLVHALQKLYRRTIDGEGWPGDGLKPGPNGHPLTHDLLTRLSAIDHAKGARFDEHPETKHQELWRHDMQRQEPSDGNYESAHSLVALSYSHQIIVAPTSPTCSPSTRAAPYQQEQQPAVFVSADPESQYALSMQRFVNPLALQSEPRQWSWGNGCNPFNEMDMMATADYAYHHFDDPIPSLICRPTPVNGAQPSDYDYFNMFFNLNPTEII